MWGTEDHVTPITGIDAARELLQPSPIQLIDCGHMAPYERPSDVAAHLTNFIDSHTDRTLS